MATEMFKQDRMYAHVVNEKNTLKFYSNEMSVCVRNLVGRVSCHSCSQHRG